MFVEPKDSRQRYTKQCLYQAFSEELEQKPVSDITVSEISEKAGVSRKTFYKYYSDQFALLKAMQDDLFVGFEEQLKELPSNIFAIAPVLIAFAGEHRVLLRAVFENRGEGNFVDRTIAYLYEAYHQDWEASNPGMAQEDVEFLFHYVAAGLVGIIRLWLFEKPDMSVQEVSQKAEYLMSLTTPR